MKDIQFDDETDYEESINVPGAYLGSAGEHLVAGQLLLNGFNVFVGSVDEGIDLVASKDNKFFKIQVKTCQDIEGYDSGKFIFRVNLTTLNRHDPDMTFVAIVVHYLGPTASLDLAGNHTNYDQDYIVIPVAEIFKITGKNEGYVVLNVRSTLTTDDYGKGFMYKLVFQGKEVVLDDFLVDSFARII